MLRYLVLPLLALSAVGCSKTDSTSFDTTLGTESYALLRIDNDSGQRDDITVTVSDAKPGSEYVLIYSSDQPQNAGWFQLPSSTDGYGVIVDRGTVPYGTTTLTLSDAHADSGYVDSVGRDRDKWSGFWAVMRVERGGESHVHVDVEATASDGDFATEPDVTRLM